MYRHLFLRLLRALPAELRDLIPGSLLYQLLIQSVESVKRYVLVPGPAHLSLRPVSGPAVFVLPGLLLLR